MRKSISRKTFNWQRGQALLVIVLVMVVALTAGLSVAIRTTTNIRTADDEENSQKAFSAAEAGLEQSLSNDSAPLITGNIDNAEYSTKVEPQGGSTFLLNNGTRILKDEPVDVWLSNYPSYAGQWDGDLTISWGSRDDVCNASEDDNSQAALEILVIYGTKADPRLKTYTVDPCVDRQASNNFEIINPSAHTMKGKEFFYKKIITISSIEPGLVMRILPLYSSTVIGIQADSNLPSQGKIITSTGTFDATQRKIVSFRGHPKLPVEIFPFIIFSPK